MRNASWEDALILLLGRSSTLFGMGERGIATLKSHHLAIFFFFFFFPNNGQLMRTPLKNVVYLQQIFISSYRVLFTLVRGE